MRRARQNKYCTSSAVRISYSTYNVEVVHTLCPVASVVDNDPESARTLFLSELLGHKHHVTQDCLLVLAGLGELRQAVAILGDDQKVDGRLWIDVPKGNAKFVVVDLVCGNVSRQDFIENGGGSSVPNGGGGLFGLFHFVG